MQNDSITEITLVRPDDWHVHLRDGAALPLTVQHSARYFGRAIVMPNLVPPITTTAQAHEYQKRIQSHIPGNKQFKPLMVLYLTDDTSAEEINLAKVSDEVQAVKLYPAGATTNSAKGVSDLEKTYPALEAMSEAGMPLLIHGEVTESSIDIFDREKIFIEQTLAPLQNRFPNLKIVLEHITTKDAVDFIESSSDKIAATITPQHLMYNRNHMLVGGIKPHYYCLPILKRNIHQQALREAIVSGSSRYFLGTDSAPHARHTKETDCGCAGCFSTHAALELYAEIFEDLGVLNKLEAFSSFNGPDFYNLSRNTDTITLRKESWQVPASYPFAEDELVPLKAGETLHWKVVQG